MSHPLVYIRDSAIVFAGAVAIMVGVAACTPATQNALNTAAASGQLMCARAAVYGPAIVAIVEAATGKPYLVNDRAAATVAATCALVQGIPVVPPADPAAVPAVAVRV